MRNLTLRCFRSKNFVIASPCKGRGDPLWSGLPRRLYEPSRNDGMDA